MVMNVRANCPERWYRLTQGRNPQGCRTEDGFVAVSPEPPRPPDDETVTHGTL